MTKRSILETSLFDPWWYLVEIIRKLFSSIILPALKALVSSVGSFLCRRPRVARPGLWARVWTSMRHGVPPSLRLLPWSPWANLLLPGPADPSMLHATCYTKHAGRLMYSVVDTTHQTLVSSLRVRLWGDRVAFINTNTTGHMELPEGWCAC